MNFEIGIVALSLVLAGGVAAIFFCNVELAPVIARKTAESAKFVRVENSVKLVRFW